jgi:putative nucleotidyltransferase with HDIG domain
MDTTVPDRQQALGILHEHVADENLRRHMLAVEAAMRSYAPRLGGDPERWGLAGLLHDFDWEIHPTLEAHPREGIPTLRERGVPDDVLQAILAHNTAGTGIERRHPMDFALLACDEVTGLIIAAALVRPHKDVRQLAVKSVKRNWKERSFAAGVDRDHVAEATADFSRACFDGRLELWEHVGHVLAAMQAAAGELGLDGCLAGEPPASPAAGGATPV